MSKEINRIHWKCRRGMREIDLLLREFSKSSLEKLNDDQLSVFEEILNYDDQTLYDFLFKQESLGNDWLTNEWFRFGASSLANDVLMQIMKQETGIYQSSDYFSID